MPVEVIMPKVDMDMASGTVVSWHAAAGQRVEQASPLFDIETDKAAMEVESPASGILYHPVDVGTQVAIGQPVAWIYAEGEAVGSPPDLDDAPAPALAEPSAVRAAASETPIVVPSDKPRATPAARRQAAAAGMSLEGITGTGPRGRIQQADVARETRAMPPGDVQSAAGPLSVIRGGGGSGHPIVLVHGFAADAGAWAELEALLPGDRPVYKIELPSHGRSPHQPVAGFKDLSARLRAAFDALDLERVHLVGHSLGGALALALADTRPRRLGRVTLIAPAGLGPQINGEVILGIARATRADSIGPWLKQLVADPGLITANYCQAVMSRRQDPALRAAQIGLADALFPDGVQSFDLSAALDRLEVPARIIWGRNDRIIPWQHALRAPGRVSLNLFENTGHLPHVERAGQIADLLAPG